MKRSKIGKQALVIASGLILVGSIGTAKTKFREGTYKGRPYSDKPIMSAKWGKRTIPGDWEPVERKAVVLENKRFLLKVLPERGGKIFVAIDKKTGVDMVNADAMFDHYPYNNENYLKDRLSLSHSKKKGIYILTPNLKLDGDPTCRKTTVESGDAVELTWTGKQKQGDTEIDCVATETISLEDSAIRVDWKCVNKGKGVLKKVFPVIKAELIPFDNLSNDPTQYDIALVPDTARNTVHRRQMENGGALLGETVNAGWFAEVKPAPDPQGLVICWTPAEGSRVYRWGGGWSGNQIMPVFEGRDLKSGQDYSVTCRLFPANPTDLASLKETLPAVMPEAKAEQIVSLLDTEFKRPVPTPMQLAANPEQKMPQAPGHGQAPIFAFAFMSGPAIIGDIETETYSNPFGEVNMAASIAQLNILKPAFTFLTGNVLESDAPDEKADLDALVKNTKTPVRLFCEEEFSEKSFAFVKEGVGFVSMHTLEAPEEFDARIKTAIADGAKDIVVISKNRYMKPNFNAIIASNNVALVLLDSHISADKLIRKGNTTFISLQNLSNLQSIDGSYAFCSVYEDRIEVQLRFRGFTSMQQENLSNQKFGIVTVPRKAADMDFAGKTVDPLPAWLGKPEFTFCLIADPQVDFMQKKRKDVLFSYKITDWAPFVQFVDEVKTIKNNAPELLVAAGDLTNRDLPIEWEWVMKYVKQIGCKLFLVPGNHDWASRKKSGAWFAYYEKYTGQKPFQALEYKGVRFIAAVQTAEGLDTKSTFGSNVFSDRELEWIAGELAKRAEHKFFVEHWQSTYWGDQLHVLKKLLEKNDVTAWLCGHRHTNMVRGLTGNTWEVITPGMVGNYGGMQCCYYLVHVFKDRIVYRLKPMETQGKYEEGQFKGLKKPTPNPVTLMYIQKTDV